MINRQSTYCKPWIRSFCVISDLIPSHPTDCQDTYVMYVYIYIHIIHYTLYIYYLSEDHIQTTVDNWLLPLFFYSIINQHSSIDVFPTMSDAVTKPKHIHDVLFVLDIHIWLFLGWQGSIPHFSIIIVYYCPCCLAFSSIIIGPAVVSCVIWGYCAFWQSWGEAQNGVQQLPFKCVTPECS